LANEHTSDATPGVAIFDNFNNLTSTNLIK
jgi:hypothetical protein